MNTYQWSASPTGSDLRDDGGRVEAMMRSAFGRGTVRSTNFLGTGCYDFRRGTNALYAGQMEADRFLLTNNQGFFEFNGSTLSVGNSVIANAIDPEFPQRFFQLLIT